MNLGDGEIGKRGMRGVPVRAALRRACANVLEGPGHKGKGLDRQDLEWAFELRKQGLAARKRRKARER